MALPIDLDDQAAREVARQIVHQVMLVAALNPGSRLAVLNAIDKIEGPLDTAYRRALGHLDEASDLDGRATGDIVGPGRYARDAVSGLLFERR